MPLLRRGYLFQLSPHPLGLEALFTAWVPFQSAIEQTKMIVRMIKPLSANVSTKTPPTTSFCKLKTGRLLMLRLPVLVVKCQC